jgi:tetratricopeptide (TPR) repeat protein
MFSGIQGCTHFTKKQQDKQGLAAETKVPMDKGDSEELSLKNIKEVLSLFPEFAKKWQGKQDLAKARIFMFKGDYEASIKYNKKVLRQFPRTLGDQALFQMGLNYAHPENPNPDNQKSIECFQSIIDEFPKSSIRDEAGIWILFLQKTIENNKRFDNLRQQKNIENNKRLDNLRLKNENLLHQIENLKNQIKKLKEIDLGIEDKKRIDLLK